METSEKISVNMNVATLSQIDLLVDGGYYSNRSDFINQAVRQILDAKQGVIDRLSEADRGGDGDGEWFLGVFAGPSETMLRAAEKKGKKMKIRGYGLLTLDKRLDDLLLANVSEIRVRGKVICSERVKERVGLK